jgi:hypothetical protein
VTEPATSARRFDADVTDPTPLARIEVAKDVDTAANAARTTVDRLVAERVGEPLHRMTGCDRISVEVQLAMDLDERHRATVACEHGETPRPQVPAPQRMCIRRLGRNRRRPASVGCTKAVHDVARFDAGPHDDTKLGELGSNAGEFDGKRALRFVQCVRFVEQRRAFRVERSELMPTVRNTPIARRIFGRRHWAPLGREDRLGEAPIEHRRRVRSARLRRNL